MMTNTRIENWDRFADHMREYIAEKTIQKYSVRGNHGCDLISLTSDIRVCVWNILKYALRIWNGRGKDHDLEKICHYAEMAWTLSDGKSNETSEKGSLMTTEV